MENVELAGKSSETLNPWTSIWLRPRATIQHIVDTDIERHVVALAALAGIVQALDNASGRNAGDMHPFPVVLLLVLILGPIFGLIGVYVWAWLLRWTGRWIDGQATLPQLRTAIAWGSVPMIAAGVPLLLVLILVGPELFTENTPRLDARPSLAIVVLALIVVQLVLTLWSVVTLLKTVAQVQRFSLWRAFVNNVAPLLVIFGVTIAAAVVAPMVAG